MDHNPTQVQRIKEKLPRARTADPFFKVFGASSHKYVLGPPAGQDVVRRFEEKYQLELPLAYKLFVTEIGNGGPKFDSAAGPFYGIYELGSGMESVLIEEPEDFLKRPSVLVPGMSDEHWKEMTAIIDADDVTDSVFNEQLNFLYQGVLPIGTQGCTYITALVVAGEHKGRVVNVDMDRQKPKFAYEENFLDWYERWLDEIILGYLLLQEGPSWFGFTMGGDERVLTQKYQAAGSDQQRLECLRGFFKIPVSLLGDASEFLVAVHQSENAEIREMALSLLTKYDYAQAREVLKATFPEQPLLVLQNIYWYGKAHAADWLPELESLLKAGVTDVELFRFATYILKEADCDLETFLISYREHPNQAIREHAVYTLSDRRQPEPVSRSTRALPVEELPAKGSFLETLRRWFGA